MTFCENVSNVCSSVPYMAVCKKTVTISPYKQDQLLSFYATRTFLCFAQKYESITEVFDFPSSCKFEDPISNLEISRWIWFCQLTPLKNTNYGRRAVCGTTNTDQANIRT